MSISQKTNGIEERIEQTAESQLYLLLISSKTSFALQFPAPWRW